MQPEKVEFIIHLRVITITIHNTGGHMAITKLEQMFDLLKSKPKKRISVAFANDPHTIEAVYSAVEKGKSFYSCLRHFV